MIPRVQLYALGVVCMIAMMSVILVIGPIIREIGS